MKLYAVELYAMGHPPRFSDCWKTQALARNHAREALRHGYQQAVILKELPRPPGHEIGARWETIETIE
jgi:hypothetical protein